jgi:zinc transport system substrate-binding protein
MKRFFYLTAAFLLIIALSGCRKSMDTGKIRITATLFPYYDFAKAIGADHVEVSLLLPPGAEPHAYEPAPKDIMAIDRSSLFIYTGDEMEPWAHEILNSMQNKNLAVIESGSLAGMPGADENRDDVHSEDHSEDHEGHDPHIWLDFGIDQKIVSAIAEKLCQIDPDNSSDYLKNADEYNRKLNELDLKYKAELEKCELNTILYGGHFAFGYLAARYGLSYLSPYEGFSPNAEPTPRKIADLIDLIRKNRIEYLFYEELLDPKVARTISSSTGVRLELLHAAHNLSREEFEKEISFLDIMESNLEKLKKALRYQE